MSSSRSAKCLFCTFTRQLRQRPPRRLFHSTPQAQKRKSPYESITAEQLGLLKAKAPEITRPYTEEEKAELRVKYTPAQVAAIEAGEASIDPEDLVTQAALRFDNYALPYLEDLSSLDPLVDKPVRAPYENHDPNLRFKTDDELEEDMTQFLMNMPEESDGSEFTEYMQNLRLTVGKEEAERNPRSYLAAPIPKLPEKAAEGGKPEDEMTLDQKRFLQRTGMTIGQYRAIRVKTLDTHRVVNQTRMGKITNFYVLSVAGNENGLIGIGEGKAAEIENAMLQSHTRAIRSMQPILRYESRTIYGDVKGKVGAVELELYHRPPGFGIRCQRYIYDICRCAGISDLAARVTRSRNPMNTVKATIQALMKQKLPDDIARARGKKMVDVRKVYYAGNTL